jgi:hypothetical protein
MHPPEKPVSQERMREILAARAGKMPPKLQWEPPVWTNPQKTAGFIREVRGRYSISKDADATDGTYSAWKCLPDTLRNGKPWKEMPVHLGVRMSRAECEALCESDAQSG